VSELALNFKQLYKYQENPTEYLSKVKGLTPVERKMLNLQHHGALRMLFKRDRNEEAILFVEDALKNPALATEYEAKQKLESMALRKKEISQSDYEARLVKWFLDKGYATTPSAVTIAISKLKMEDNIDFSGEYQCNLLLGEQLQPLTIKIDVPNKKIEVNQEVLVEPFFGSDHVIWSNSKKNRSTGVLTFIDNINHIELKGKYSPLGMALPSKFNLTNEEQQHVLHH
jgi:hypothetical protein